MGRSYGPMQKYVLQCIVTAMLSVTWLNGLEHCLITSYVQQAYRVHSLNSRGLWSFVCSLFLAPVDLKTFSKILTVVSNQK